MHATFSEVHGKPTKKIHWCMLFVDDTECHETKQKIQFTKQHYMK